MDMDDHLYWRDSNKHVFNLKTAYTKLAEANWDTKLPIWKLIWTLSVPQRLRVFLWITFKQRLMTNFERCRLFIGHDPFCPACHSHQESTLHVLRDCNVAKEVGSLVDPSLISAIFIKLICRIGSWPILLARSGRSLGIAFSNITWTRYYAESKSQTTLSATSVHVPVYWKVPNPGWISLNVDGAVSIHTGFGTVGGVFRDHEGAWVFGFNKTIGITEPLQAELWAIFIGIQIAWDHGFEFLIVHTDSLEAVKLLEYPNAATSSLPLIRAIDKAHQKAWVTVIHGTPRQGNIRADAIAKLANPLCHEAIIMEEPPAALLSLLDNDKLSVNLL
ncbi:hypothetical protein F3Y22_tig00110895pilonHSYRG00551 [Hibiscus syriacus]|uniref:RNase H type-1 domain-containing protein n=1 Tax=Hibiscus syriacus TaxID=106335 RepID=A0A6A2ZF22_HIBSY|nr:hypothetical protein F3Y22_tig00110895pilonHSYRG00551 [Hibiscus syriacus]